MARTMRRRRIRYQRLGRLRRNSRQFMDWLREQADRLSVPVRALRDALRLLGPMYASQVEAAADAGEAGVVISSAATVNFVKSASLPAQLGAKSTAPVVLGVESYDSVGDGFVLGHAHVPTGDGFVLGASSVDVVVDFVAGENDDPDTIVRETGSWLADGFRPGCTATVADSANGDNDGPHTILSVSDLVLEVANGTLTAGSADEVTLTSLNVISGFGPDVNRVGVGRDLVLSAATTGANDATYEVADKGADFVILDSALDTAEGLDEAVVITNTAVISGFVSTELLVPGVEITLADATDGDNDADYNVDVRGLNWVLLTSDLPGDTGVDETVVISSHGLIVREGDGSFVDDGFKPTMRLDIEGTFEGGNDLTAESISVVAPNVIQMDADFTNLGELFDGALVSQDVLSLAEDNWDDAGFGDDMLVYVGSALLGEIDDLVVSDTILQLDDPIPDLLLGKVGMVGLASTIVRGDGSFAADGFAAGDRIRVDSGPNAGDYRVATPGTTTMTLTGDVLAESDLASEDVIYRLAPKSRD